MASSGVEMDQLGRLLAERWRRMLLRISLRIPSRLATTGTGDLLVPAPWTRVAIAMREG